MKPFRVAAAAAIAALVYSASPAWADKVTLNFDGPDNSGIPKATDAKGNVLPGQDFGPLVLGYYDADGRKGSQDFGVTLSDQAVALCAPADPGKGCYGNFKNAYSGSWAVGVIEKGATSFDLWVGAEFVITDLGFFYNDTGTQSKPGVELYRGQDLVKASMLQTCDSFFCGWREFQANDLGDSGITRISFLQGAPGAVVFDSITLTTKQRDQPPPLPEPSTTALLALGLASMGWAARRRKR